MTKKHVRTQSLHTINSNKNFKSLETITTATTKLFTRQEKQHNSVNNKNMQNNRSQQPSKLNMASTDNNTAPIKCPQMMSRLELHLGLPRRQLHNMIAFKGALCALLLFSFLVLITAIPTTTTTIEHNSYYRAPTVASFSMPSQAINISHVTYDPLYDTVYVGATNSLYQLNGNDLSLQLHQSTGPVMDNPSCGITDCRGYEDYMKPTSNVNKILVIDYKHHKLLSCGSVKQGACTRYQLNNIAQKGDLINMAVAANDDNSSTYAFIAPAKYSSSHKDQQAIDLHQQQQVLYVATTFTKPAGLSRDLTVPAIGSRILDEGASLLSLYEHSFVDYARLDISRHLQDYFLVDYLYGFASSNYVYFVTVQRKATSRDYEELGYHTRLARVCITDSSFNSYTEVDLKCMPNQTKRRQQSKTTASNGRVNDYPLLQDAMLVEAGSQLLESLGLHNVSPGGDPMQSSTTPLPFGSSRVGQPGSSSPGGNPDDSKVLIGVFSSAKDHTQHPGDHSAVCAFSLTQIEDIFNDNIHSCYTGKMQSRNMEYIAGNVQDCSKASGQTGNVVNFCTETLKINGTIPIVAEAAIEYQNTTLTAITATSHINSNERNIYSDQLASDLAAFNSSARSKFMQLQQHQEQQLQQALNQLQDNSKQQHQQQQVQAQNQPQAQPQSQPQSHQLPRLPHTVAFLGTSTGHIKKILLDNSTAATEFEDLRLDIESASSAGSNAQSPPQIIADLHLHSSGNHLIVATANKLFKVATHNCGQHQTCRECSQSRNPYCGWCSLKRSCTTKAECTADQPQPQPQSQPQQVDASSVIVQTRQQLKWISNDNPAAKCIDLQAIVPDKIPISSTNKVDLYIDRLPRTQRDHSYRCIFDRNQQTSATQTAFGLTCPLPKLAQRPKLASGQDHVVVEVAVRSTETNTDFLTGKITFFECQQHSSCKECLSTSWNCNWCLNENICLFNTSKCDKPQQQQQQQQPQQQLLSLQLFQSKSLLRHSNTISLHSQCPSIDFNANGNTNAALQLATASSSSSSSSNLNAKSTSSRLPVEQYSPILIAHGSDLQLSVAVKNMPQIKGNVQCVIEIENDKFTLKARLDEDRVVCDNKTFAYSAPAGTSSGRLTLVHSDQNILIDRTNLTLYKCDQLALYSNRHDCSLCHRLDPRLGCSWCPQTSTCELRNSNPNCPNLHAQHQHACPAPRIDSVTPTSGPTAGGTRLTIEGTNLGESFEEIANRVLVANVPCRPIEHEYRVSNRIVCVTMASSMGLNSELIGEIQVGNRAGYSLASNHQLKFTYKPVSLREASPRAGPQSGGTRLTLTGTNLNVGAQLRVLLDELACQVDPTTVTPTRLQCVTSRSPQASRSIRRIRLLVDDAESSLEPAGGAFFYGPDPTISRLSSQSSYLSGGKPLLVHGANLNLVQAPKMLVSDPQTNRRLNETLCSLIDATKMHCPTPGLSHLSQGDSSDSPDLPGQLASELSWQPVASLLSSGQVEQSRFVSSQSTPELDQQQQQQLVVSKVRVSFQLNTVTIVYVEDLLYMRDPKLYAFASRDFRQASEADLLSSSPSSVSSSIVDDQDDVIVLQASAPLATNSAPLLIKLVLYGERLRSNIHNDFELAVTVGQQPCQLLRLGDSALECQLASDRLATPTDELGRATERKLPAVVVRVGAQLRFELGFARYESQLAHRLVASSAELMPPGAEPDHPELLDRYLENTANRQPQPSSWLSTGQLALFVICLLVLAIVAFNLAQMVLVLHRKRNSHHKQHLSSSNTITSSRHFLKRPLPPTISRKAVLAAIDQAQRSVAHDCAMHSSTLRMELAELGASLDSRRLVAPTVHFRHYVMRVFFPGIQNHPLLLNGASPSINTNPTTSVEGADQFERLLLDRNFLLAFVNTLEQQPAFSIRDKVNVASLLMVVLMGHMDYASDLIRHLLSQLARKTVAHHHHEQQQQQHQTTASPPSMTMRHQDTTLSHGNQGHTKQSTRASNLMFAFAPSSAVASGKRVGVASKLRKVASASAHSLLGVGQAAANSLLRSRNSPYLADSGHYEQPGSYYHTIGLSMRHQQQQHLSSCASQSQPLRLMLRRSDSIVEKMLANWLAINMFGQFQSQSSGHLQLRSLFMLVEALRRQLERGPVEPNGPSAYYGLSERSQLRSAPSDFGPVELHLLVDLASSPSMPVKVSLRALDCDLVSQLRLKVAAELRVLGIMSSNLASDSLDLHIQHPGGHMVPLRDLTDEYSRQASCLRHYGLRAGARATIVVRRASEHTYADITYASQHQQQQHIHQQQQQQQQAIYSSSGSSTSTNQVASSSLSAAAATTSSPNALSVTNLLEQPIYCQIGSACDQQAGASYGYYCATTATTAPAQSQTEHQQQQQVGRMLIAKSAVQSSVDDLFRCMLNQGVGCDSASISPAVKWLFDLLDELAIENGLESDPLVVHSWKSNAFLLRFWLNMIKNPHFVLDIDKPQQHVDASLSVVAQLLMDSCSPESSYLNYSNNNEDSASPSKLMFSRDVQKYAQSIRSFYQQVGAMQPVNDHQLAAHVNSLVDANQQSFDTKLAVRELFVYANNFRPQLLDSLEADFQCQQFHLAQQLNECFNPFASIFGPYQ